MSSKVPYVLEMYNNNIELCLNYTRDEGKIALEKLFKKKSSYNNYIKL